MRFRLSVVVTSGVTVAEARRRIEAKLRGPDERIEWEKGTLPDPETKLRGTLFWRSAIAKQGREPDA